MRDDLVRCPQYALYFAINKPETVVKIGHSWNPQRRWRGITYVPHAGVTLDRYLVIVPESGDLTESNLLARFSKYRTKPNCGDFFNAVPEIMDFAHSLLPGIRKSEFDTPEHRRQVELWREQKVERQLEIARLAEDGYSREFIGERFGVSPATIYSIQHTIRTALAKEAE